MQAETSAESVSFGEEWVEGEIAQTVIDYRYDELYRLTEANYSDGTFFHYTYDSNGNRVSETTAVGTVESVYDSANRLTSVGATSYTWDANGSLLSDGVTSYTYDHANRLVSVSRAGLSATTPLFPVPAIFAGPPSSPLRRASPRIYPCAIIFSA